MIFDFYMELCMWFTADEHLVIIYWSNWSPKTYFWLEIWPAIKATRIIMPSYCMLQVVMVRDESRIFNKGGLVHCERGELECVVWVRGCLPSHTKCGKNIFFLCKAQETLFLSLDPSQNGTSTLRSHQSTHICCILYLSILKHDMIFGPTGSRAVLQVTL